ncbi:spore coat protein [Bacillus sp. FJAT-27225]|uniref:Hsp20/alpha crystallin family protein n=1 Tax=Bacillus sp. FJAT-27225 TaxID=1743144 RepID=UPI00080C2576|nr:Hsp20/alpha crystallin family protein [Bacillus sp. FJAT-27225]OCA81676.1 spore coat protein [Bacillus sp. FJAT-27225]
MDMNKIMQWMDMAKKYQSSNFWSDIFEQSSFEEFMKSNLDMGWAGQSRADTTQAKGFPPTDIYKTDDEIFVISDLAGYMKEEIRLSVSGTKLLIKGNRNEIAAGEPVQQERYQGEFNRIIQLPEPTFPDQIRAKFTNGLLIIRYHRQFKSDEQVPIE